MRRERSRWLLALCVAALAPVASASGQVRGAPGPRGASAKPFLDVRDGDRLAVARRGDPSLRAPAGATRAARDRLRATGAQLVVDPLTGTPRVLAGARVLSGPSTAGPADVADRFVREHLVAFGLDHADLGSLALDRRIAIPGGAHEVVYRQYADGIPSFDGGLRVLVDATGRVVRVIGAPQADLAPASTRPTLSASDALRRLMGDVGVQRDVEVVSGPDGLRRATRFAGGESAALSVFAEGTTARLAWQLDYRATPLAHYTALIDASTGTILYRANSVKTAANDALVWEQYPGAANGGGAQTRDLSPYLNAGATDLSGPYAHAWSDANDSDTAVDSDGHIVPNDHPDAGEAVTRTGAGGSFAFGFSPVSAAADPFGACDTAHPCSWNYDAKTSWQANRAQNAVQAFWYVNRFRDHLAAAPTSFTAADGNFDDGDRVLVNTDDGAATGAGGGPDGNHVDNAYMDTPRNGTSPTMAMFLFFNNASAPNTPADFRDVNGGDDADIVYHEYTHGLSGRLVTTADGEQALNEPQPGAMGEGWSDFYAKDFLVDEFPADDTAAAGDVDMGKYIDSVPHTIRSQGLDCPVGAAAGACPGGGTAGSGGYTYGDFGRVSGSGPEVHADGEIWAETLWDLRAAMGSDVARALVTQGMRLSPPEPTFLDERDAILAADRQLFPDADHSGQIWQVFAARGMGWNALSPGSAVTVEGFKRPPTAVLSLSPSPGVAGQPVTLDASGSTDPDGSVTSYDFDFQGDGIQDVIGSPDPHRSFTYPATGTFHPVVTAHDDEGRTDTASRTLVVNAPSTSSPPVGGGPAAATPGAAVLGSSAKSVAPSLTLPRTGSKGRVRIVVRCDSACSGTARLTVSRTLAGRLRLGRSRTVGTLRIRRTAAGEGTYTLTLSRATLRAIKRIGLRRLTAILTLTVTDAEQQHATGQAKIRVTR